MKLKSEKDKKNMKKYVVHFQVFFVAGVELISKLSSDELQTPLCSLIQLLKYTKIHCFDVSKSKQKKTKICERQ